MSAYNQSQEIGKNNLLNIPLQNNQQGGQYSQIDTSAGSYASRLFENAASACKITRYSLSPLPESQRV